MTTAATPPATTPDTAHAPQPERVTRIGGYAVCVDGDRLLLCRVAPGYPFSGQWTLPGGGLEFGEDPAAGTLRELEEEAGLHGEIDGLLGVYSRHFRSDETVSGRELHAVGILYRVRIVGGDVRDEVDGSTDRCAWLTPDERQALPLGDLAHLAERLAVAGPRGAARP